MADEKLHSQIFHRLFAINRSEMRISMKKSSLLKKLSSAVLVAVTVTGLTACNTKIKVTFDCNANDYVKLGQYKGIEVTVDSTSVRDSLVAEKMNNDLEDVTEYSEVTREAREDDRLTLVFTGAIGGSTIDGFSSDSYTMVLGKDEFIIPGFTDALYGMKAGEQKIVTLTVPEGIQDAEDYANKRIVYEITMAKVEQQIVPMITDAYAKEYFGYDTVDAYRQALIDEMKDTIDENIANAKKQAVLEKLQENAEVKGYPEDIIKTKSEEFKKSINFYSMMYGMNENEYCIDRYGISFDEYVKRSVVQQLIMQLIIEKENLTVTEYEYKGDLDAFAEANGYSDEEKFVQEFGRDKIVQNMLLQKAVDVVMDSAVITEE